MPTWQQIIENLWPGRRKVPNSGLRTATTQQTLFARANLSGGPLTFRALQVACERKSGPISPSILNARIKNIQEAKLLGGRSKATS